MAADDQPVCPMLLATRRFPKRTKRTRDVRFSRLDVRLCEDAMGRAARAWHLRRSFNGHRRSAPMSQNFFIDPSRSLTTLEQDSTIIAVIEMSQSKWLVAAVIPGVERQPLKKLDRGPAALLKLLQRRGDEAPTAGRMIRRIVCAYEAGRDGFWLARWLRGHAIEAYGIHAARTAVSREHR